MSSECSEGRRCLWLHQNFVTAQQPGNSRPRHLIAALLESDWKVHVVAPEGGYMGGGVGLDDSRTQSGRLTIERVSLSEEYSPFSNRALAYFEFAFKSLFAGVRTGPVDRVFSSTPPLPQVIPSILISIIRGAPLILEVRDLWPIYAVDVGVLRGRWVIFTMEWLEALAYRFADRIVVTSPPYTKYLEAMGVDPSLICVAPTGGDSRYQTVDPDEGARWRRSNDAEGKLIVLYAGSFNDAYELGPLLGAAETLATRYHDILCCFAGNGRQIDQIDALAARYPNVRYLGNLNQDELAAVLSASDIGLVTHANVPILETALSGKVFDYLAAGLPVVSASQGITAALIERAQAGTVVERSAESVVDAVLEMSRAGEEERKRLGRSGQAWVLEHVEASQMGRAIAEVVAEARPVGRMSLVLRLLRAFAFGFFDLLARRSRRSANALMARHRFGAEESLDEWLRTSARPREGAKR